MKNVIQGSLITTFRCNAQCNMCNIWKFQTNPNEEIDASYYEKLPAGLRTVCVLPATMSFPCSQRSSATGSSTPAARR